MKNKKQRQIDKQRKRDKIKDFFTSPIALSAFSFILGLFFLMYIIFVAEQKTNSKINTFFDAFWYTLVTITTVGYGDITPDSVLGRLAAMILLLAGVAIFGAMSGQFASFLFERQQKKDRGLLKMTRMKNHFLICGYKPNFSKILEGILFANPEIPADKIILLNNAPASEMEIIKSDKRFKPIHFLRGDFTDEELLLKAHIQSAEKAIVLADCSENYSTLEIDSRTVLAVITIKNLNPKIYCVAEILDSKFEKHLNLAHCDEIILSADYERSLLATASSGKGYSNVIRELIADDTGSGILIEDIPSFFIGKSYGEFKKFQNSSSVLVGLLLNTGNFYQRRKDALREAQKNPDVKVIVDNLKKVKLLKSNQPLLTPPSEFIIQPYTKAIFIKGKSLEGEN